MGEEDSEFEALMQAAQVGVTQCGIHGCRNTLSLVAHSCRFCHLNHCTAHRLSENHGCGADVKREARNKHMAGTHAGLPQARRDQLEKKLKDRTRRPKK